MKPRVYELIKTYDLPEIQTGEEPLCLRVEILRDEKTYFPKVYAMDYFRIPPTFGLNNGNREWQAMSTSDKKFYAICDSFEFDDIKENSLEAALEVTIQRIFEPFLDPSIKSST